MDSKPRIEWNGLPGLLAAERLPGNGDRDDFNRLELGFDAKTLAEFLKEPIEAISNQLRSPKPETRSKGEDNLTTLVIRTSKVVVMAERERVAEEERIKDGRRQHQ